jgi:small GTP-binding protein
MAWNDRAYLTFKVTAFGDAGVGKTCIVNRQCDGSYIDEIPMTVRVAAKTTRVTIGRQTVELKIWDSAGEEHCSSLVPMFCRGTEVCVLVADLTRPDTIEPLTRWHGHITSAGLNPQFFAALNKTDLVSDPNLTPFEDQLKSREVTNFVSAKTSFKINLLFITCAQLAVVGSGSKTSSEGIPVIVTSERQSCF